MTNLANAEIIRAVDYAAGMNDRWLFVASLVLFGLFAGIVMRYFVRQHDLLIADQRLARSSWEMTLRQILTEQAEGNVKLILALEQNSRILDECREAMVWCRSKNRLEK